MSVTCVPHNFAVIRLEEGNEVKIVKRRQLRLKTFSAGSMCRLIVHNGIPKPAKIVRTFMSVVEAKKFVDNINSLKMSWGFGGSTSSSSTASPESCTASTTAVRNVCEAKGPTCSVQVASRFQLHKVSAVKPREVMRVVDTERTTKKRTHTVSLRMLCRNKGSMDNPEEDGGEEDESFDGNDQSEDEEDPVCMKMAKPDGRVAPNNKPDFALDGRRQMAFDITQALDNDSGVSNPSNSSPEPLTQNEDDDDSAEVEAVPAVKVCPSALQMLPTLIQAVEASQVLTKELLREHANMSKMVMKMDNFMGELKRNKLMKDVDRGMGVTYDFVRKHLVDVFFMKTSNNPTAFFQLVCKAVFSRRESALSWRDRPPPKRDEAERLLNFYFPSPSPEKRMQRILSRLARLDVGFQGQEQHSLSVPILSEPDPSPIPITNRPRSHPLNSAEPESGFEGDLDRDEDIHTIQHLINEQVFTLRNPNRTLDGPVDQNNLDLPDMVCMDAHEQLVQPEQ